jgi:hypothetical protein
VKYFFLLAKIFQMISLAPGFLTKFAARCILRRFAAVDPARWK